MARRMCQIVARALPGREGTTARAMMGDDADDATSDGSLETLPGTEEFLQTAIRELSFRRSPSLKQSPSGRHAENSSAFGSPDAYAAAAAGDSPGDVARDEYDDAENDAIDEFLAASVSPSRPASPSAADPPPVSPRQLMEQMTASLRLEHHVTEAVLEDILEEALLRTAYPDENHTTSRSPPPAPEPVPVPAPSPIITRAGPYSSSPRTPGSGHGPGHGHGPGPSPPTPRSPADAAMIDARVKLSEALRAIAESLAAGRWAEIDAAAAPARTSADLEDQLELDAVGVTGAIVRVWKACDAASSALTAAMVEREEELAGLGAGGVAGSATTTPTSNAAPRRYPTSGSPRRARRQMLEEAVFSAWMQSGDNAANLMFSEEPLPTTASWPLSPGGGAAKRSEAGEVLEEAAAETIEENVAAAAAAAASAPSPDGRDLLAGADVARWAGSVGVASPASAADESPRLEGARRTARWRAVVRQLALASLQRIQADAALAMDEADEAKDSTAAAAAADAEPRSPSPPPSPPPPMSHAARRSAMRSAQEWEDLELIAEYMTTTRLLSAAMDEWREWTAVSRENRRAALERERAMAVVEREIARMEFIQRCLRGWRDHCRRIERERRARFGAVSRKSIRAITSSPKSPARLLSPPRDESARLTPTSFASVALTTSQRVRQRMAAAGVRALAPGTPGTTGRFSPLSARGVGDAESPGSRGDSSPKSPVAPPAPTPVRIFSSSGKKSRSRDRDRDRADAVEFARPTLGSSPRAASGRGASDFADPSELGGLGGADGSLLRQIYGSSDI